MIIKLDKAYFCLFAALVLSRGVAAQDVTMGHYKYADETQLWRLTQNAAGLSQDSLCSRGVAYFDLGHRSGDFHRVQEGGQNNNLEFYTERYQKVGKYLYGYGSFKFDMGRTKERAWSDVVRAQLPYSVSGERAESGGSPFISGSSVPGKYDNQDFELNASLSTVRFGHFTYGANLLYKVGDLSRLRDPRSRINLAEYRLTPAVTYAAGQHTVGLAAHYDRRKEKLPGLTTVQTDPSLEYYVMTGLSAATGIIGGYNGYMREYVDHELGAELSYGWKGANFRTLNSLALSKATEYVYGTNKYEPGRYHAYKYGFTSMNRLRTGSLLHSADFDLGHEEAYADEFRQERISVTDSVTGFNSVSWNTTLLYKKRYQLKRWDARLHYRCSVVGEQAVSGYLGAGLAVQHVSSKHLLPTDELKYGSTRMFLEGGIPLAGRHLWIEAQAGYNIAKTPELRLAGSDALAASEGNEYVQAVLQPDMLFYGSNYFSGGLKLTCQLPITIEHKTRNWFVSAYGDYISAKNDQSRCLLGCSVGLYY